MHEFSNFKTTTEILLSAYFDDINLMGLPQSVGKALPELVSGLEQCGLQINPRKCELFHPDAEDEEWAKGMNRQTDGVIMLYRSSFGL